MYCANIRLSSGKLLYSDDEAACAESEISLRTPLVQERTSPNIARDRWAGLLALKSLLPPVSCAISSFRNINRDLQYCSLTELAKLEGAAGVVGLSFVLSNGEAESAVVVDDDSDDDGKVVVVGSLILEPEKRRRLEFESRDPARLGSMFHRFVGAFFWYRFVVQNVFRRRCAAEDVLWTKAVAIGYGFFSDTLLIVDENPDMVTSIDIVVTMTSKSIAARQEDPNKSKLPEFLLLFLLFVIDSMRNHTFGRSCTV